MYSVDRESGVVYLADIMDTIFSEIVGVTNRGFLFPQHFAWGSNQYFCLEFRMVFGCRNRSDFQLQVSRATETPRRFVISS